MKKTVMVLISFALLVNTAFCYNLEAIIKGLSLVVTTEKDNIVTIVPKIEEVKGWEVVSGNIEEVINNQITMPGSDVIIRGILEIISPYTITTIEDEFAEIEGIYTNYKCSSCGGKDHECEVINILIELLKTNF